MVEDPTKIKILGYKIIRPIGQGGMATVYLAVQESIDREVAIKIMSPALASDSSFSERFVKEARMANLSHPNIITVYDAGLSNGQNFIAMELATGGNLDSAINEGLSAARAVVIIKAISSALHYSCSKGFIHRDVKPENILFKDDGSALLVDFGIAKAISSGTRLTVVGSTIGSPNYMSPEQARGLVLDGRSDLYALGVVFYEALTGIKPFDASDTYVIGLKHISDPIPQLPKPFTKFQTIIDQLLAKEPGGRFENGLALNQALDNIVLEDIDNTVIPSSDFTYDDTPTHVDLKEKDTRLSPDFGEKETLVVDAVDGKTQVLSHLKTSDATKVLVTDDTTVMSSTDSTVDLSKENVKKSNASVVWILLILVVSIAGFFGWQNQQKKPTSVLPIVKPVVKHTAPVIRTEPIDVKPKSTDVVVDNRVTTYLEKAEVYFKKKRLTTPAEKNAFYMYGKVLEIDPKNKAAKSGINKIADQYYIYADKSFNKKENDKALGYIEKGLKVVPDHEKLLSLEEKIIFSKKQKPDIKNDSRLTVKTVKKEIFEIRENKSVLSLIGRHNSKSFAEAERFSRNNMSNKIYYLALSQCNDNANLFETPSCRNLYQNLIRQWPVSLKADAYSEIENQKLKRGKLVFNKQEAIQSYQADLNKFRVKDIEKSLSKKQTRIRIANQLVRRPVTLLLGLQEKADLNKLWNQSIEATIESAQVIDNSFDLISQIKILVGNKNTFIKPFVSKNSFEITPFASALYQSLLDELTSSSMIDATYQLRGELELIKTGGMVLNLWVFNQYDEVIDVKSLKLAKSIFKNYRVSNIFYNEDVFPVMPLNKSYGFPADVRIQNSSSNALLLVGDETNLLVKLDNAGFFYIAVHVVRESEQFSYLLPLRQGKVPFVQVGLRNQKYQYTSLGKFDITAPIGVETIQLIASNINLEKYLPPYAWSEKRQQFIIRGSEGNIVKGISEVRQSSNRIHDTAHDKNAQWQERLLVTTILEKQKL